MHLSSLLFLGSSVLLANTASALDLFGLGSHVEVTAAFPASNPFSHVFNGQKNPISITVENKQDVEIDIIKVFGSFKFPSSEKVARNTTTLAYKVSVPSKQKVTLPYTINSEFKPQDLRLNLWLEYRSSGNPETLQAFDSIVSIVEPPASIFDVQLILTYLMVVGLLAGGAYIAYQSFAPPPKKKSGKKRDAPSSASSAEPAASSTPAKSVASEASTTGYDEDWIPVHHIQTRSAVKKARASAGGASSGEESTGVKTRSSRRK